MSHFSKPPPNVSARLSPFVFSIPKEDIDTLKTRLSYPLPKAFWENSQADGKFGVTRDWLAKAVAQWQAYDWDKYQDRINSVPSFTTAVEDEGEDHTVHFAALFSQKADATPVILMHGWPGSFIEFLPIMTKVKNTYASDPASLPYHLIVPSLPGYVFSPGSAKKNITTSIAARILHKLMLTLGFGETGYVAQGGDVGSGLARHMALEFDECIGAHLNMLPMAPPKNVAELPPPTEAEMISLGRSAEFRDNGMGYSIIHGTKPSTIGLVVASSPQGLLAWIGEKMIAWAHEPPSIETIIANVSLYWFTGCFPSSIWIYREMVRTSQLNVNDSWSLDGIKKPFGFSSFPYELAAPPKSWIDSKGTVSFYRSHDKGGHFAALEQPDLLWQDVVEFVDHIKAS